MDDDFYEEDFGVADKKVEPSVEELARTKTFRQLRRLFVNANWTDQLSKNHSGSRRGV